MTPDQLVKLLISPDLAKQVDVPLRRQIILNF
jgi:hypothetical protein